MASPKTLYATAQTRGTRATERGRLWLESRDASSRTGTTIGWFQRYRAADGQLYALLLAAYVFMTALPLLLVFSSYAYRDPTALARRVEARLDLAPATARMFETVMVGTSQHKLTGLVIAVVNVFYFGVGFGRVLQLVHARSWKIDLRKRALVDQILYFEVLAALTVLMLLYVLQTKALKGEPSWVGLLLDVVWVAVLVGFFVWAPRLLLHRRVPARDLLPGAVFTVAGFLSLRLLSVILLRRWLEWYSSTYGGFGFAMALFFWLVLLTTVMVLAAALAPALAHRRDLRRAEG